MSTLVRGEGLGQKGEGIARVMGMPVFIPGLLPGEDALVRLNDRKTSYARGELMTLLQPSPQRRDPFCPAFGICGGCHLQHLDYEAGIAWKRDYVRQLFRHQGGLDVDVRDTIPSEELHGVRNKVQLPFASVDEELCLGFYAARSHRVIPIASCPMQSPLANKALRIFKDLLPDLKTSVYNERLRTGMLRHLILRTDRDDDQIQITLVVNDDQVPGLTSLIPAVRGQLPEMNGLLLNINRSAGNKVLSNTYHLLWGSSLLEDRIGSYTYRMTPGSFFQTNRFLTETLYETALEMVDLQGNESVVDLYCGVGTISLYLARRAAMVYGVELYPQAIVEARQNAMANGIDNVKFIVGAAESMFDDLLAHEVPDLVLVDPPRRGCDTALLQAIMKARIPKIVYISCNPATLVRDAIFLCSAGYEMSAVQPVDMFPWTEHIECCCSFTRI